MHDNDIVLAGPGDARPHEAGEGGQPEQQRPGAAGGRDVAARHGRQNAKPESGSIEVEIADRLD